MVTLKALDPAAIETALFVEHMDKLFNTFNSNSFTSNQSMRHSFSQTSGHKEFLHNTLLWLESLESGSSRKLPCMTGWKISIQSLLQLWEELHSTHNLKYLMTSRINQDCIENLFSVVRGKGGHMDNPDPKHFRLFFRQAMVDAVLRQSKTSNCLEDGEKFLVSLDAMGNTPQVDPSPLQNIPLPVQHQDGDNATLMNVAFMFPSEQLNTVEKNVLTYISGYIVRKIRKKVCEQCCRILTGSLQGNVNETFLKEKQFSGLSGGGLVIPSDILVSTVEHLETVFKQSAEQLLYMNRCRARMISRMLKDSEHNDSLTCPAGVCHNMPHYIIQLFVSIRLYFILKDNNRHFASERGRQNRKVLKLSHQ